MNTFDKKLKWETCGKYGYHADVVIGVLKFFIQVYKIEFNDDSDLFIEINLFGEDIVDKKINTKSFVAAKKMARSLFKEELVKMYTGLYHWIN